MPYAYRKRERLRKNSEILTVVKQGKRLSADGLSLFYAKNGAEDFRVAVSVSKKLANSVGRNKLRRQLRAALMRLLAGQARGYDLVFVARQGLVGAPFERVLATVNGVLARTVLRSAP